MELILVRHAAAVEATPGTPDADRRLSAEGRAFFRKTATTIHRTRVDSPVILTSPLRRAFQTAEILAATLQIKEVVAREELQPGFDLPRLQALLREFRKAPVLVLVGHEPDMGLVLGQLLSLPATVGFKKGTAVNLRVDPEGLGETAFIWLAEEKKLVQSRQEAFGPPPTTKKEEIAAQATGSAGKGVGELKEKAAALSGQLHDGAKEIRNRFREELAGKTGRKVEKELLRLLSSLEAAEETSKTKGKKGGKTLVRTEKRLTGVTEGGLKDIRKKLKRARKTMERVFAP